MVTYRQICALINLWNALKKILSYLSYSHCIVLFWHRLVWRPTWGRLLWELRPCSTKADESQTSHVSFMSDICQTVLGALGCVHIAFCSGQNNTGGLLEWSACGVREKTLSVGFDWLKGLTRIRLNIHQQHWVSGRYIPTNGLFCQDRQTQPEQVLLHFLVYQADPIMRFELLCFQWVTYPKWSILGNTD